MPPRKKKEEAETRQALTVADLASYDDLLTAALIDNVYFWTTIRKNRPTKFVPPRGLPEEELSAIIRNRVIIDKNTGLAEKELLRIVGLQKFAERLSSKQQDEFRRHMRLYISIYLPDCQWEVTTTNRYTILQHEASVTARKEIAKGQVIRYLCGTQVTMTQADEETLNQFRNDFSIVMSKRKKAMSLFLGPARFANHDCNANARLMTSGTRGMTVIAARSILPGEEITVSYGDDYFGSNNCECLCRTCEQNRRNGWKPSDEEVVQLLTSATQEESLSPYSFRRKRRYMLDSSISAEPEVAPIELPKRRKRGRQSMLRVASTADGLPMDIEPMDTASDSQITPTQTPTRTHELSTAPVLPVNHAEPSDLLRVALKLEAAKSDDGNGSEIPNFSCSEASDSLSATSQSTAATSTSIQPEEKVTLTLTGLQPVQRRDTEQSPLVLVEKIAKSIELPTSSPNEIEMVTTVEPEEIVIETVLQSVESKPEQTDSMILDTEHPPAGAPQQAATRISISQNATPKVDLKKRVPGDYMTSRSLLVHAYSAWVSCTNCQSNFIQHDSYFTKAYCERCERHSKLYGFVWPKTEKEGKWDKEERVLDHRTVHKFISHKEEIRVRRGLSPSQGSDTEQAEEPATKKRGRPRKAKAVAVRSLRPKGKMQIRVKARLKTAVKAVRKVSSKKQELLLRPPVLKRGPGRPRKVVQEETTPVKRPVGRPRKVRPGKVELSPYQRQYKARSTSIAKRRSLREGGSAAVIPKRSKRAERPLPMRYSGRRSRRVRKVRLLD